MSVMLYDVSAVCGCCVKDYCAVPLLHGTGI